MKTDIELRHDVEAELDWDPRFDSRNIGVAVKDGVVTLSGHVDSYPARWAAQDAARSVVGVKAIANEVQVTLGRESRRSDTEIAQVALNALQSNATIPPADIKIVVRDGLITLEGSVAFWFQKNAAEQTVRHIRGVTGIVDNLIVKPQKVSASVQDVKKKIEDAFRRHAQLDAQKIQVKVGDGAITLAGEVHTWLERDEAESAAWAAPGVSRVDNRIAVRP